MIISDLNVLETVTAENVIGGCSHRSRHDRRRKRDDHKKYYDRCIDKKEDTKSDCKCDGKKEDKYVEKKVIVVYEPKHSYKC